MSKLNLGNDFTDEEGGASKGEEAEEKESPEEEEEEKENSADDADSENQEDESEEESEDESESDSEESSTDEDEDESESGQTDEEKQRELQGLLDTEKGLDSDGATLDEKIAAARLRISQKRGDRRVKRGLVENIDTILPEEDEGEVDDLSDIAPDTLQLLERFTKAKGLVPKSELQKISYSGAHKAAEKTFFDAHPEYSPENDTDDALYTAIKEELKDFAAPKDPAKIPALFEKAHREVMRKYPDRFTGSNSKDKKPEKKGVDDKTKSASVRLKSQRLGGGNNSGGGGKSDDESDGGSKKTFSEVQINALRQGGWTDDEIKRLTK